MNKVKERTDDVSMHRLRSIRCASVAQLKAWVEMYDKALTNGRAGDPMVRTFCNDGLPEWCAEQAVEGNCFRADPTRVRR